MKCFRPLVEPYLIMLCSFGLVFGVIPLQIVRAQPIQVCNDIASFTVEARPFVSVQCNAYKTAFGDGKAPSVAYQFDTLIGKSGDFIGKDAYGRSVTFVAVSVLPIPVRELQPAAFAEGDEASMCFGYLVGPMGKAPVLIASIKKPSLTLDLERSIVVIVQNLTAVDIARVEQVDRIMAGAMVYDIKTGRSISLTQAANAGLNQALSVNQSDLATLNATDPAAGQITPALTCLQIAFKTFNVNEEYGRRNYEACMSAAIKTYVASLAVCGLAAAVVPIGAPLVAVTCVLLAAAHLVIQVDACKALLKSQRIANYETLKLMLITCGVVMYEI